MNATTGLERFRLDARLSGLELLHNWIEQKYVAGFNGRMRSRPVAARAGYARFECAIDAGHENFVSLVHGGVAAALIDIAGGAAAMSLLAPGETLLTVDLSARYLNAAPIDTRLLIAAATASYHDARKVVTDVRVSTAPGELLVVLGSVTVLRRPANR